MGKDQSTPGDSLVFRAFALAMLVVLVSHAYRDTFNGFGGLIVTFLCGAYASTTPWLIRKIRT